VLAKEQLAPDGSPEQVNETVWLKPPSGVMVSAVFPLCPGALTVTVVGFADIWKSTTSKGVAGEDELA